MQGLIYGCIVIPQYGTRENVTSGIQCEVLLHLCFWTQHFLSCFVLHGRIF